MFCAFDNPALIFRIDCGARCCRRTRTGVLSPRGSSCCPARAEIFVVAIDQVQTSCGWGVPYMAYERERDTLSKYHEKHGDATRFAKYAVRTTSIDGLPVRNPTVTA
ncbi:hypothetical protein AB5I41_21015 [Sphingomonas sp. MMS24-JH45]